MVLVKGVDFIHLSKFTQLVSIFLVSVCFKGDNTNIQTKTFAPCIIVVLEIS